VDTVRGALDKLSKDVDAQTKRVSEKGGEISQKLQSLDAKADVIYGRLDTTVKSLETKVAQVSKQADIVSVRQAYPTLGRSKFVTYNWSQWKGKQGKKEPEKWINIYIDANSVGKFSTEQITKLIEELQKAGYTPLPGMFGIGGPYTAGYGPLGNSDKPTIFYFQRGAEPLAAEAAAITAKVLSIKSLTPQYSDISAFHQKDLTFVVENSGLDLQLYLVRSDR
jgi:hypothetical protein